MSTTVFAIVGLVILGVVLTLLGLFLVFRTLRTRRQARASQTWPETTGTVVSSRVEQALPAQPDRPAASSPVVEYRYEVAGKTYTGSRSPTPLDRLSRDRAENTLEPFPPGAQIRVYYNPEYPAESVLEITASKTTNMLIAGVFITAMGATALFAALGLLVFIGITG